MRACAWKEESKIERETETERETDQSMVGVWGFTLNRDVFDKIILSWVES